MALKRSSDSPQEAPPSSKAFGVSKTPPPPSSKASSESRIPPPPSSKASPESRIPPPSSKARFESRYPPPLSSRGRLDSSRDLSAFATAGARRAPRRQSRVLLVDDSAVCLEAASIFLEEGGFEVVTVDSPFGLSSALAQEDPDLVLVDVGMPGLAGDKLVEITLRNRPSGRACPLVLYSDRPAEELERLSRECGAAGFIRKSSDGAALIDALRRFLLG